LADTRSARVAERGESRGRHRRSDSRRDGGTCLAGLVAPRDPHAGGTARTGRCPGLLPRGRVEDVRSRVIGDSGRASPVLPDDSVAVFADVVKEFRRGSERVNLRAALPWSRRGPVPERQPQHLAVDCVSMSLRRGEALGVVGPNGAGKSTLLRLLGGITLPTSGEVWTRGRIASLIELGVGFHPDLT